jgi:DNA recombination protein Rad52
MFTDSQVNQLKEPLDRAVVKTRAQGGKNLSYIEGWQAIKTANTIFGFGNWKRELVKCTMVREDQVQNKAGKDVWDVAYIAVVRITVYSTDTTGGPEIVREGIGYGSGLGMYKPGDAHESASKEAETDAMKRALMTFGNPFGLALYDKEQKEVETKIEDPEIDEDNPPDPTEAPNPTVAKKWKFVAAAQEQKLRVGTEAYYETLSGFQLEKSNRIAPADTPLMNQIMKALKALPDKVEE